MKLEPYLIPFSKMLSKKIKDLNIRADTLKLLHENTRKSSLKFGLDSDFLEMTPKAQATNEKINKWDTSN